MFLSPSDHPHWVMRAAASGCLSAGHFATSAIQWSRSTIGSTRCRQRQPRAVLDCTPSDLFVNAERRSPPGGARAGV
jgi:hypothetical protein